MYTLCEMIPLRSAYSNVSDTLYVGTSWQIIVLFSMSFPAPLIAFQTRPSRIKAEHHQSLTCSAGALVIHSPQELCCWEQDWILWESEKWYVSLLTQDLTVM